ncbi:hypothetical protein AAE478_001844 [Parahypoxylon ruwenzoriense]
MSGNSTSSAPHGSTQVPPPHKQPYPNAILAILGGIPSRHIDDPVAGVLLALFLLSALAHGGVLYSNRARGRLFAFSGMLLALCLLRGVSLVVRLAWAAHPRTPAAALAAGVTAQCGSVLVYVVNLLLALRVLRAYRPRLGWHRASATAVWFLIACVLCCLVMAVAATVHDFYVPGQADRAVQLFAGTYLAFLAFLPVPVVGAAVLAHRMSSSSPSPPRIFKFHLPRPLRQHGSNRDNSIEKFGAGRWRTKLELLVFTSIVATLGAGFRLGVNFDGQLAGSSSSGGGGQSAWFHSRASYYCFNFVTDLAVSTAYLLARFDRRFVVPDGARGPGDYAAGRQLIRAEPVTEEATPMTAAPGACGLSLRSLGSLGKPSTLLPPPRRRPPMPSYVQCHADSSGTAVQRSLTTSSSSDRRREKPSTKSSRPERRETEMGVIKSTVHRSRSEADYAYVPDSSGNGSGGNTTDADPLVGCGSPGEKGERRSNACGMLWRAWREHGGSSVRSPEPAHLGPPILPDLDLDLELLSVTLLAPWALHGWGFDSRRSSWRNSGIVPPNPATATGSGGNRDNDSGASGGGSSSNYSRHDGRARTL